MKKALILAVMLFMIPAAATQAKEKTDASIEWAQLTPVPGSLGLAGAFAGVYQPDQEGANPVLILAGGANFPTPLVDEQGNKHPENKRWHDEIYVLDNMQGDWIHAGTLPRPLAYGASVSVAGGVLCIGGNDSGGHYADVFLLSWNGSSVDVKPMPSLPKSCANCCAAVLDKVVYVAGGTETPSDKTAMKNFWAIDLSAENPQWQVVEPWPGAGRILPVAAAQGGSFFVLSGAELNDGLRTYLTDGYRFTPDQDSPFTGTWQPIADLYQPRLAAPSPAPAVGQSHFLVMGGDVGDQAGISPGEHKGFSRSVMAYHTITDTWAELGSLPAGHVTATAVQWDDKMAIVSGEIRPGIRSPEVITGSFAKAQSGFGMIDYAAWGGYMIVMLAMGFYFSKRENSTHDFFLGGQRVKWWAAGISIFGTQLSAITFMAIPAKVYSTDWVYIIAQATIIMVAPIIVFCYLPYFRRFGITTAYEYLEKRFSLPVRLLGSLLFCLMQLARMGIVLFLPALALSTVTDMNIYACILAMGVICTIYTVMGGIEAVIWTDVIQVIVLMGGAVVCIIMIAFDIDGGLGGIISMGQSADKFHVFDFEWSLTMPVVWIVLVGNIFQNMIPFSSDQTVVQRYLTTPTEKQARNAIWTNSALTVPGALIFFFLGTALWSFYKTHPAQLNPTLNTDSVLPWFLSTQMPAGLAGLVLAAVFAAAMSSLDSSMNSMATVLVTDFHTRLKPDGDDHQRLALARWITVVLGAFGTGCAVLMAGFEIKSLFDLFLGLLGLLGSGLAGMFILGIFTKRANSFGAFVGLLVSGGLLFWAQNYTSVHFFLYAPLGILTCVIVGYLASFAGPGRAASSELI